MKPSPPSALGERVADKATLRAVDQTGWCPALSPVCQEEDNGHKRQSTRHLVFMSKIDILYSFLLRERTRHDREKVIESRDNIKT